MRRKYDCFNLAYTGREGVPRPSLQQAIHQYLSTLVTAEITRSGPVPNTHEAIKRILDSSNLRLDFTQRERLTTGIEASLEEYKPQETTTDKLIKRLPAWTKQWQASRTETYISGGARNIQRLIDLQPAANRAPEFVASDITLSPLDNALGVLISELQPPPSIALCSLGEGVNSDTNNTNADLVQTLENAGFVVFWNISGDDHWDVEGNRIQTRGPLSHLGTSKGIGYSGRTYEKTTLTAIMLNEAALAQESIEPTDFTIFVDPEMPPANHADNEATLKALKKLCTDRQLQWAATSTTPESEMVTNTTVTDEQAHALARSFTRWIGRSETVHAMGGPFAHPTVPGVRALTTSMIGSIPGTVVSSEHERSRQTAPSLSATDQSLLNERRRLVNNGISWRPTVDSLSVIIAVGPEYVPFLADALRSVATQRLDKTTVQICIQFDGSETQARESGFLQQMAEASKNFNLSIGINGQNLGPAATRNAALQRATGDMVMTLDSDDILSSPNVIQTIVDTANNNPRAGWIIGESHPWRPHPDSGIHEKPPWLTPDHSKHSKIPADQQAPRARFITPNNFRGDSESGWWKIMMDTQDPLFSCRRELGIALGWASQTMHEDISMMAAAGAIAPGIVVQTPMREYRSWEGQMSLHNSDVPDFAGYQGVSTHADAIADTQVLRLGPEL